MFVRENLEFWACKILGGGPQKVGEATFQLLDKLILTLDLNFWVAFR